jgi:ketosteroid isomerase-like protein
MTRLRLAGFVTGLLAGLAIAAPSGVTQTTPAEKAVMQAIDDINGAFQRRDVKAYEALTTADFIRVTSGGPVYGRTEWLKTVAAPGAERRPGKYDEVSVRVYGDGAVVTYRNLPTGPNGQPGATGWLTRVMAREGSQWKMALAQSTDLKPPPPATGPAPMALPAWSPTTAAEREALAAFQAIQKANASRDLAAWERLSAPDHTIITPEGARISRAERVASLKAPAPAAADAGTATPDREVRVVVKGDVAAVTWMGGGNRSLKVLARRAGTWQQVLQQASPIVGAK